MFFHKWMSSWNSAKLSSWSRSKLSPWSVAIGSITLLLSLTACTDYVAEIDDQIKDHRALHPVDPDEVIVGSMTDSRDGQSYKTVTIGLQTWMAKNLNYETDSSFCYSNEKNNCIKYGRLYTWAAATSACPSGWHLPSKTEWEALFTAVGGYSSATTVLKSTSGWKWRNVSGEGTDAFGFSVLPAGFRNDDGNFYSEGDGANFWSSTEGRIDGTYYDMNLFCSDDSACLYDNDKHYAFSVRCLKDDGVMPESSPSTGLSSSSESPFNPNIEYGELNDSRDGQIYKTVKIGLQTWMAQNLNYKTDSSSCYNDSTEYCDKYGRLYTWTAAKTACPSGWHLPKSEEWETLFNAVGGMSTAGKVLKTASDWYSGGNGTDAFGFSALPAGNGDGNGEFNYESYLAYFWSSTELDSYYAYDIHLYCSYDNAGLVYDGKDYGFSVRCLQD